MVPSRLSGGGGKLSLEGEERLKSVRDPNSEDRSQVEGTSYEELREKLMSSV